MESTIKIHVGNGGHSVDMKRFPGGEVHVTLPELAYWDVEAVNVEVKLRCSDGVMALAMVKEALDYECVRKDMHKNLTMGYIPYARQDRRCNERESLSIKVFAGMINAMKFDSVMVVDPHSDVAPALLDNVVRITDQTDLLGRFKQHHGDLYQKLHDEELTLVAPDVGASKKIESVAKHFNHESFIQGHKRRDLKTGHLSGFGYTGVVRGRDLLIVDDICDGGGTFIGLAHELLEGGANTVSLYVTHGIFSAGKGPHHLLDNGIHKIYTTDSYYDGLNSNLIQSLKL